MNKKNLLVTILSIAFMISCSITTSNTNATSSNEENDIIADIDNNEDEQDNVLSNFNIPFNPFFNFTTLRAEKARIEKEIFEDVEMTPNTTYYGQEDCLEGTECVDREYANTYIHWLDHNNNHIYTEISYPNDFDENKKYTTIIAAHGYQSATATYIPYFNYMKDQDFIFISFDFRGTGEYTKSDGLLIEMTLDTMVGDLKAVTSYAQSLPFVDTNNMYLMGHSLGGVASAVAMTSMYFENAFNGVTLLAPAFSLITTYQKEYQNKVVPETVDLLGFTVSREFVLSLLRHSDVLTNLNYYNNKVLVFANENDPLVSNEPIYSFAESYGENATLYTLEGPDHFFIKEGSTEFICDQLIKMINTTHRDSDNIFENEMFIPNGFIPNEPFNFDENN